MYYSYVLLKVIAEAHEENIIHRDIKFDNIMVDRNIFKI